MRVYPEAVEHRTSAPVVANGRVFVASDGDPARLQAFAARDGLPLWSASIGSAPGIGVRTPALAGDNVLVSLPGGGIAAFDAAGELHCNGTAPDRTCEPVWKVTELVISGATTPFGLTSTPTVADEIAYVTTFPVFTVALRISDGAQLWVGNVGVPFVGSSPTISADKVFVMGGQQIMAFVAPRETVACLLTATWRVHRCGSRASSHS